MTPKLEARSLTIRAGARVLVENFSLSVPAGKILGLVGPSGIGKTTVAKALCDLQPISAGAVCIDGKPLASLPANRKPVLVWQSATLFQHLTVRENAAVGLRLSGTARPDDARVDGLLEELGISHLAALPVQKLSGGEQARVCFARALAVEPAVLILDEPFASLDIQFRSTAAELLRRYVVGQDRAAILISHASEDVLQLCELASVIENAAPAPQISIQQLIARPRSGFEALFGGYWKVVPAEIAGEGPDFYCRTKWHDFATPVAGWIEGQQPVRGRKAAMIFLKADHVPEPDQAILGHVLDVDASQAESVLVTVAGNRPFRVKSDAMPKAGADIWIRPRNPLMIAGSDY